MLHLVAADVTARLGGDVFVDAVDCRRIDQPVRGPCGSVPAGVEVRDGVTSVRTAMAALAAEGVVPDVAVFALADNSTLTRADLDAAMAAAAGVDRVWWVNTRIDGFGRQDLNNRLLDRFAAGDPRASVVDWHAASDGRPWLADHVHPNAAGQDALAALIADRVRCGCGS